MNGSDILTLVTIFVLAAFVGFEVISKVPSILHTPLMSGTNAIHGVVLVGAMVVLGQASGSVELTLGFIAVVLATLNVVGGFVVTDRMLEMFKGRQTRPGTGGGAETASPAAVAAPAAAVAAAAAAAAPAATAAAPAAEAPPATAAAPAADITATMPVDAAPAEPAPAVDEVPEQAPTSEIRTNEA